MSAEPTPSWALPLFQLVERIDQKLDGQKESILDHEARLREVEATQATLATVAQAQVRLDESLVEVFQRLRALEKKMWMAVGVISAITTVAGYAAFTIKIG
jgi:hypothetical protein